MPGFVQLDLFGDRPEPDRTAEGASETPSAPEGLSDDDPISAISNATLADAFAITAEVGKRRLSAAVPALISLCKRLFGYGASVAVPEQVAALHALGAIGGEEAAHAVSSLITKKIVQGPTLITALKVAAQLGVFYQVTSLCVCCETQIRHSAQRPAVASARDTRSSRSWFP
jgi:hypothetical protein